VKKVEDLIAPGAIFKRILESLRKEPTGLCVDGPAEYQRGFHEGYREAYRNAIRDVQSVEGNLACEVTALRHRKMREGSNEADSGEKG
jgi:hypothetical protein